MDKKNVIDIINVTNEQKYIHETKNKTLPEFSSMNFEEIIINHHKKNASTSTYILTDENKDQIVVLLTQDPELIKELKLPTYSRAESPNKSLELFDDRGLEDVSLSNILTGMEEHSKVDFLFNFDSQAYSISVSQGKPAKKLIHAVHLYIEEIQNIKEYTDSEKQNSLKF